MLPSLSSGPRSILQEESEQGVAEVLGPGERGYIFTQHKWITRIRNVLEYMQFLLLLRSPTCADFLKINPKAKFSIFWLYHS